MGNRGFFFVLSFCPNDSTFVVVATSAGAFFIDRVSLIALAGLALFLNEEFRTLESIINKNHSEEQTLYVSFGKAFSFPTPTCFVP